MQQRESVFCVLFPQSGPFIEGERGRPSVDLGCTKGALILSREPNKSTEKHVQKETSLSSMAIEPPPPPPPSSPMDATNQALQGIKGQNVGNVFGGRHRGKCRETRGGTRAYHQQ